MGKQGLSVPPFYFILFFPRQAQRKGNISAGKLQREKLRHGKMREGPVPTSNTRTRCISPRGSPRPGSPSLEPVPTAILNPQPVPQLPSCRSGQRAIKVRSSLLGRWVTPRVEAAAGGSLCVQRQGVSRDYFPGAEQAHTVPWCCSSTGYGVAAGHTLSTAVREGHPQADLLLRTSHNQHDIRSAVVVLQTHRPGEHSPWYLLGVSISLVEMGGPLE